MCVCAVVYMCTGCDSDSCGGMCGMICIQLTVCVRCVLYVYVCILYVMCVLSMCMWYVCVVCEVCVVCVFRGGV